MRVRIRVFILIYSELTNSGFIGSFVVGIKLLVAYARLLIKIDNISACKNFVIANR